MIFRKKYRNSLLKTIVIITMEQQPKSSHPTEMQPLIEEFFNSLTANQRKGLNVAKRLLGSSFTLEKSSVYLKWKSTQKS